MGSFFVLSVKSGHEKSVRDQIVYERTKQSLEKVKGVYALESYTSLQEDKEDILYKEIDFTQLSEQQLSEYLHVLQMQHYIHELRSYNRANDTSWGCEQYRDEIRRLTKEISNVKVSKSAYLLKGYVLIETVQKYETIPIDLWYALKEIPYVLSIPNKNSIPEEEISLFFQQVEHVKNLHKKIEQTVVTTKEELTQLSWVFD